MELLGKYWGDDLSKPDYQKQSVLDEFYQDVTLIDIMFDLRYTFGLTYQQCLDWAQEKIDLAGIIGLTPAEIRVATQHGLIIGEI